MMELEATEGVQRQLRRMEAELEDRLAAVLALESEASEMQQLLLRAREKLHAKLGLVNSEVARERKEAIACKETIESALQEVQASADGYKIELEARGKRITELEGTLPQAQERACNLEASLAAQLKDVGARARVLDEREAAVVVRERRSEEQDQVLLARERALVQAMPLVVHTQNGISSSSGASAASPATSMQAKGLTEVERCEILLEDMEKALETLSNEVEDLNDKLAAAQHRQQQAELARDMAEEKLAALMVVGQKDSAASRAVETAGGSGDPAAEQRVRELQAQLAEQTSVVCQLEHRIAEKEAREAARAGEHASAEGAGQQAEGVERAHTSQEQTEVIERQVMTIQHQKHLIAGLESRIQEQQAAMDKQQSTTQHQKNVIAGMQVKISDLEEVAVLAATFEARAKEWEALALKRTEAESAPAHGQTEQEGIEAFQDGSPTESTSSPCVPASMTIMPGAYPASMQDFCQQNGLQVYAEMMRNNEVDLDVLRDLSAEDWQEMGVATEDLPRLLAAISCLPEDFPPHTHSTSSPAAPQPLRSPASPQPLRPRPVLPPPSQPELSEDELQRIAAIQGRMMLEGW